MVYPAFPYEAKGLLLTAIEDNNPVLFFEHKKLYRSVEQEVPQATYQLLLGVAQFRAKGTAAVVITYGQGVHWALKALQEFPENSVSVLDLNTLQPWIVMACLKP